MARRPVNELDYHVGEPAPSPNSEFWGLTLRLVVIVLGIAACLHGCLTYFAVVEVWIHGIRGGGVGAVVLLLSGIAIGIPGLIAAFVAHRRGDWRAGKWLAVFTLDLVLLGLLILRVRGLL
jgi:hypothetical protein